MNNIHFSEDYTIKNFISLYDLLKNYFILLNIKDYRKRNMVIVRIIYLLNLLLNNQPHMYLSTNIMRKLETTQNIKDINEILNEYLTFINSLSTDSTNTEKTELLELINSISIENIANKNSIIKNVILRLIEIYYIVTTDKEQSPEMLKNKRNLSENKLTNKPNRTKLVPWYKNFKGQIIQYDDNTWLSQGHLEIDEKKKKENHNNKVFSIDI